MDRFWATHKMVNGVLTFIGDVPENLIFSEVAYNAYNNPIEIYCAFKNSKRSYQEFGRFSDGSWIQYEHNGIAYDVCEEMTNLLESKRLTMKTNQNNEIH